MEVANLARHMMLGEILIAKGFISNGQLEYALVDQKRTGKRLGEYLVDESIISQANLTEALEAQAASDPMNRVMRVSRFSKVSRDRYIEDWAGIEENYKAAYVYDTIRLPKRATSGSAGYDFFAPFGFTLNPGESIKIPSGIRAEISPGWVMMLFPRATLGFKYKLKLDNTIGVIDSDYSHSFNEGHIFIKLSNCGEQTVRFMAGDPIVQGIFLPFGITMDDDAFIQRNGGIGSTDERDL